MFLHRRQTNNPIKLIHYSDEMCRKQDRGAGVIRAPMWQPQPGSGSGQPREQLTRG